MSSSAETRIPTGLNRIKTHRESILSANRRHNLELDDPPDKSSPISADGDNRKGKGLLSASLPPPPSSKQKFVANSQSDHRYYRGKKKITAWLSSYLSKESSQNIHHIPLSIEGDVHTGKIMNKEDGRKIEMHEEGMNMGEGSTPPDTSSAKKVLKDFKSFSHELGLGGGFPPVQPRVHSYDDLKELLGSFYVRFDEAKEVVNVELVSFTRDVMEYLEEDKSTGHEMAKELLLLAQNCIDMNSFEFQVRCEEIVQGLTENRQLCQTGLLKWLFTRMLFILTRCTRLIQFQKDAEPTEEKEFHKFKQIFKSIPAVESDCLSNSGIAATSSARTLDEKVATESCRNEQNIKTPKESLFPIGQSKQFSQVAQVCEPDDGRFSKRVNESSYDYEKQQSPDRSHSVICRICEEVVPASHLESHSYLCAHADKCAMKFSSVDERLCKLAEVLEQIVESRNNILQPSSSTLENSRSRPTHIGSGFEGYSPRTSEWEDRCDEGMIENLHEMDTADINDSHFPNGLFLKGPLSIKFSTYGPSSSPGSMTSGSSANTPKSTHFDLFWLEHYNGAAEEDADQISNLADIARCVAATDISEEGSCEIMTACMHDLQELIEQSKLKALVVDTFGGRIEVLLREKYMLARELFDSRLEESDDETNKSSGILVDEPSQSSAVSTPIHTSNKERTNIGDFEIIKPISRGAFGKVFLARKRTTGDLFAIKVLKKLDMICKNDIECILAERNILIAVRNPFVVRFYYSFTSRDNLYLVMEYLNGGDLYSLLRKVGCLEEDVGRIYVAELVLALEYIHSLGIVHRDLKPDNILIAHDGHIKLTDFGLSKFGLMNSTTSLNGSDVDGKASLDAPDHNAQRIEAAVGTPDYLAPEILLGTEHGYAADWWSVGVILFELISGIPPFSANSAEIIFDNILNRKIPWPPIPSYMSHEAQDLIARLLIEDPEKRLGAQGSSEVKSHPFFKGVNWDTLASQKAAFVPQPDAIDDTSYFVSRNNLSFRMSEDQDSSDSSASIVSCSCPDAEVEMDECGELANSDSSSIDFLQINFSYKSLSQLATINRDVLLRTGKDAIRRSSTP